jgi:hypothetical protein
MFHLLQSPFANGVWIGIMDMNNCPELVVEGWSGTPHQFANHIRAGSSEKEIDFYEVLVCQCCD